ncbi:hypothetical protein [Nonomuraea sp. NPDC049400]|uniref:hypothetical protein n=1 Tax=Nonomuraea sp. NPDC049400 TaxID=3364352 RepID=UPI0037ACA759
MSSAARSADSACSAAGRRLDPDDTRRYLTYLARAFPPTDTRDIGWWHIANTTPRICSAAGLAAKRVSAMPWTKVNPGYANLRLRGRTRQLLRCIKGAQKIGLGAGLGFGLLAGLMFGLKAGLAVGPGFGLTITLAFGLLDWAEHPTITSTSTPRSSWQADRALALLRMAAFGLLFALLLGSSLGLVGELGFGLAAALGLVSGAVAGLTTGDHHAWLICTIAVTRLTLRHQLPLRIMGFLDDAHRLGLLRAVGPVYQFRHAALRDHLAAADTSSEAS